MHVLEKDISRLYFTVGHHKCQFIATQNLKMHRANLICVETPFRIQQSPCHGWLFNETFPRDFTIRNKDLAFVNVYKNATNAIRSGPITNGSISLIRHGRTSCPIVSANFVMSYTQ